MKLAWDPKSRLEKHGSTYQRERSIDLYHTNRWTKLSKAFRAEPEHTLCVECKSKGLYVSASVVDHIVPWPVCGLDGFFDRKNLQPLCDKCNNAKGQRDKRIIAEWRKTQIK